MTDVQTRTSTEQHEECRRTGSTPTRRAVLTGAGALGATCLLAACGTDTSSGTATPEPPAGSAAAPAGGAATTAPAAGGGSSQALALVADVPEGGGVIKGDYVITQPTAGNFKAFSKKCTHQGCPVSEIDGGSIKCKCHNSDFSITDGAPTSGPAKTPLEEMKVKVDGDSIVAA